MSKMFSSSKINCPGDENIFLKKLVLFAVEGENVWFDLYEIWLIWFFRFSPRRYLAERYILEIYYEQNIGVTFQFLDGGKKCLSFRLDWKYLPSSNSDMWIFIKKLEKTFFEYSISIFCHEIAHALGLSTWLS